MRNKKRLYSVVVAALLVTGLLVSPSGTPSSAGVASGLPTPTKYFGFAMGTTGKLAGFSQVENYAKLAAQKSPRVQFSVPGKTGLGNDFPVVVMSSPANLRNLSKIKTANKRLANPQGLSAKAAKQLAATTKPVYLIEATIHSTEVANGQAIVDLLYRFANENSDYVNNVLNNSVLVFVLSANPDGQKLVVDYFNQTAGTDYNRTYPDLYNKYTGHDDNRDWFLFTQPETQMLVKLEQEYWPVVDQPLHQQGTTGQRITLPPYTEPVSPDIDQSTTAGQSTLGTVGAQALAAQNDTGVSWGQDYGIMWTADVANYDSYRGTSLNLIETATGTDLAYPYTSPDGKPIGSQVRRVGFTPYTSNTWTLKQAVQYAETAMYVQIKNVADNPSQWLIDNLYTVNTRNISQPVEGEPYAYVIPKGQRDEYAVRELLQTLDVGLVQVDRAKAKFTAGGKQYAAGSYVIRTAQPAGTWVDQLLTTRNYPETTRACATCPLIYPYSEMTNNLGMLFGVTVNAVPASFDATLASVNLKQLPVPAFPGQPGAHGAYLIPPESYGIGNALAALQQAGVPTFRSTTTFSAADRSFAPGTLIVAPTGQARAALQDFATTTGLAVYATKTAPSVASVGLKSGARIGLVRGINNMPGGWLEWMFDRDHVNYHVVSADDYAHLGDLYDTIVLASGVSQKSIVTGLDTTKYPPQFGWARGVGTTGWNQLAAWVKAGGNLVAIGTASTTAQQLLNLPITDPTPTQQSQFSIPGSLINTTYNPDVEATWGMPSQWPVWFDDNAAYQVTDTSHAQIGSSYPTSGDLLATGYALGADNLHGLANVVTFSEGSGSVTLTGTDINFRSWTRSTYTVLTNAMYQGGQREVSAGQLPGELGS